MKCLIDRTYVSVTEDYCKEKGLENIYFENGKATVDIETIEDIISLLKKTGEGEFVINEKGQIEIYDDYRE